MHETTRLSFEEGTVNITLNSESLYEIAPPAYRPADYDNLVEACFTKKELEAISGGQTADLSLNLAISEDISDEFLKQQLDAAIQKEEASLGKLSEGMYIEFSAEKTAPGSPSESLSTLSDDVFIEIDVPLYLISEERSYWIMVSNMGEYVLLPDLDPEPDSITISTHNLGTGIILYQDPLDSLADNSETGSHPNIRHFLFAGIILLLALWIFLTHLHKNDM